MANTGICCGSNRSTDGSPASSGNSPLTRSTRSRMSSIAWSMLVPFWNIMTMRDEPDWDWEEIVSMPVSELRAASSGRVTSFSDSPGAAPVYDVATTATGRSISGNRSTARWRKLKSPRATAAMTTIATPIGRRTDTSTILTSPALPGDRDGRAVAKEQLPFRHDQAAFRQRTADGGPVRLGGEHVHPDFPCPAVFDGKNAGRPALLHDGRRRHDHGVLRQRAFQHDVGRHARHKIAGV